MRIETSTAPSNPKSMLFRASTLVSDLLGKGEEWIMASIESDLPMVFAASNEPCAHVRLESIGLPADQCPAMAEALCDFLQGELGVAKDRIYIHFVDVDRRYYGWNGKTFA